jgi:PKD repeat protein
MAINISVTPGLTGNVYETDFIFKKNSPELFTEYVWDMGDGSLYYELTSVNHTYQFPGVYTVSLSAWTEWGQVFTSSEYVTVDYLHRDALEFDQIPVLNGLPGLASHQPFVVSLTSAKISETKKVVLHPLNTKSVPHYAVPEKWDFLVPRWRFVDAVTMEILQDDSIIIDTVPVYKNNKIVAVTGRASFYYIDDSSTGTDSKTTCPLTILATLSTTHFTYPPESLRFPYYSYSNNETVKAAAFWRIEDVIPTKFLITENFLSEIYELKWTNIPIPVLITCEYDPSLLPNYTPLMGVDKTKVLSYPRRNEFGKAGPVKLWLSGLPPNSFYVNDEPLHFRSTNDQGIIDSGYIFTTITSLCSISSTVVQASAVVTNFDLNGALKFSFPSGYAISPSAYISHPTKNVINKIFLVPSPITREKSLCPYLDQLIEEKVVIDGKIDAYLVPNSGTVNPINYDLGTTGVYGMAFDPVSKILYAGDADKDLLYKFNNSGVLLSTVSLSAFTNNTNNTPSCITIDKHGDLWVSLYTSQAILKLDSNLNFLLSAYPTITTDLTAMFDGSFYVEPPVLETDQNNNVWVCYGHPLSSMLVKFNSAGQEILKADLPLSSVPVSIAVDAAVDVWVACRESNEIRCYDSLSGALKKSFNGILKPSYIAIDRDNNIWFTHGHDFCSKLNYVTSFIETWKYDPISKNLNLITTGYSLSDIHLANTDNEIWGGLAVDVYDRVWLINSVQNEAIVFYTDDTSSTRNIDVIPFPTTNFVLHPVTNSVLSVPSTNVRSAQAAGDWTGNKWFQKFAGGVNKMNVYGTSASFEIKNIHNPIFLSKKNEEFDCSAHMHSLALPELLKNNSNLFQDFLPAVVGTGDPNVESIGRVAYEKIANFVQAHGDYESSDVSQLNSMAEELNVPHKDFGVDFPVQIQRLINIFSTPKHMLRGVPNIESNLINNMGLLIHPNDQIEAGSYVFAKDRSTNLYQLIYVNALSSGQTSYSLSSIQLEGFKQPAMSFYDFYTYLPNTLEGYVNSVINWDSPFTTVSYSTSSTKDWFGTNGIVETSFNQVLTKMLFDID